MSELISQNGPVLLVALVIVVVVGWWLLVASRRTRIQRSEAPGEDLPARRNQALIDAPPASADVEDGAIGHVLVDRDERVFLVGERPFDLVAEIADGLGQVERDDKFVFDDQDGRAFAVFHADFISNAPPEWVARGDSLNRLDARRFP